MKKVSVEFTKISDGAKTTRFILADSSVDKYEIMTEYEECLDFGYIISKIEVVADNIKIHQAGTDVAMGNFSELGGK